MMDTTSLWKVSGSLKKVLDYAENPNKTSLKNVIDYASDSVKTDDELFMGVSQLLGEMIKIKSFELEKLSAIITLWPACFNSKAATLESTPPDNPTAILSGLKSFEFCCKPLLELQNS